MQVPLQTDRIFKVLYRNRTLQQFLFAYKIFELRYELIIIIRNSSNIDIISYPVPDSCAETMNIISVLFLDLINSISILFLLRLTIPSYNNNDRTVIIHKKPTASEINIKGISSTPHPAYKS